MFSLYGHLLLVVDQNNKHFEMGYTIAEFDKTLHGQFITEEAAYKCLEKSTTHWQIMVNDFYSVDINIAQAPSRKIAMLELPVLIVYFKFDSANTEQQKTFLKRFFKYFHKGGG